MENNKAINQLKAISSASFSGPREGGGRVWFPLFAHALLSVIRTHLHKGESTNNVLVPTCSGLWRFLNLATNNPLLQHTVITNRSIWKHSDFPNPVGRWPHTNFTFADCCSHLSITLGVPSCWRTFYRAWSSSLVTHAIFTTVIHG